jgi:hypothetical protein
MGLRPVQDDEKRLPCSNYCTWKQCPRPLSSRPKRSEVEGPVGSAATPVHQLLSPEAPPSPLSSRPDRSAVERSAVLEVFFNSAINQS